MKLIDTHCHLYLKEFSGDLPGILLRAEQEGVEKIYLPAIDSSCIEDMMWLEKLYPSKCFAMAGLHPCYVKANYEDELLIVQRQLSERKFAAVGEIGLDYYWDKQFAKEQLIAFNLQIQLAAEYDLPVVIHSRSSMEDSIAMIRKHRDTGIRGIFHCFSGTIQEGMDIIDAGLYLGIGGVVTYKNAGLAEVVAGLPVERLVLETDAPYLSPVPFRGKRNESSYLKYILAKIAEVKKVSVEELASITTANAQKIFGQ